MNRIHSISNGESYITGSRHIWKWSMETCNSTSYTRRSYLQYLCKDTLLPPPFFQGVTYDWFYNFHYYTLKEKTLQSRPLHLLILFRIFKKVAHCNIQQKELQCFFVFFRLEYSFLSLCDLRIDWVSSVQSQTATTQEEGIFWMTNESSNGDRAGYTCFYSTSENETSAEI